jgi:hypothetical protein
MQIASHTFTCPSKSVRKTGTETLISANNRADGWRPVVLEMKNHR